MVHATVCTSAPSEKFLQLLVDYKYRHYAVGDIPQTLNRRDRMTDEDVIISRLIDRSIRPLFPTGYLQDIQVCSIKLSSVLCVSMLR